MNLSDPGELAEGVRAGEPRAAARLISLAENRDAIADDAMAELASATGNAAVIGITGPPGSGKSTLVDKLADHYRRRDQTVGVVAVDPTSPFTGGAVLADRIRMATRSTDPEVYASLVGMRPEAVAGG